MYNKIITLFISLLLIGCASEVDKCVEAQIKARGKLDDLALQHGATNVETKEEVEARARLMCLQASQGKL
jgi:hypothetical protein